MKRNPAKIAQNKRNATIARRLAREIRMAREIEENRARILANFERIKQENREDLEAYNKATPEKRAEIDAFFDKPGSIPNGFQY